MFTAVQLVLYGKDVLKLCIIIHSLVSMRAASIKRPKKSNFFKQNLLLHEAESTDTFKQWKSNTNKIQHKFQFIRDLPTVCKSKEGHNSIELLVLVTSSHNHMDKRQSLRDSWLIAFQNNTSNMRYIFILGETVDKILPPKLIKEAEEYNDMVVANFRDTYRNLTLKTIAGFHWAMKHCAHARFVMKTDDDMYVNIPGLLDKLAKENEDFSLGKLQKNLPPIRNKNHKWFLSREEYPNTTYPDYYNGPGYVLSMKHVRGILSVYPNVEFLPFEDVFVGLCLKQLGLKLRYTELHLCVRTIKPFPLCVYKYRNVITAHEVPGSLMKTIFYEACNSSEHLSSSRWFELIKIHELY